MNRQRPATSTQPQVDPTLGIYSSKAIPTVKVKLKDSDDDVELIINQKDFDDDRYVRLD